VQVVVDVVVGRHGEVTHAHGQYGSVAGRSLLGPTRWDTPGTRSGASRTDRDRWAPSPVSTSRTDPDT
jgi:hypothetical protein